MKEHENDANNLSDVEKRTPNKRNAKEVVFLTSVAGMSICMGFGYTIALAKKKDPNMFNKGLIGSVAVPESGGALALRALAWGSLYSVAGVGILSYGIWKLIGAKNMEEFRTKVQSVVPQVPKRENPGKSDFKTVRELVNYVIDSDNKKGKGS